MKRLNLKKQNNMSNSIKSISKSVNVSIGAEINGATVNVSYNQQGADAPQNAIVNANFNGSGVNSSLNRNYFNKGADFEPKPSVEIFPFTADFETALKGVIDQVFVKYATPEDITI